ncbi:MAG: bifunctional serine/threonine-protein kinase/formylglycine-generating enzyme family protein [Blastocatellia bacterium]|nr:bifunctional serine/threonine-protein kinase/formylglycine-generating enzyme family protein [Blastocatellia bacterium]
MINQQVGSYRITNYLGRGAISEIYRASSLEDATVRYAVKSINRNGADRQTFAEAMRRLFADMRSLDHPKIIRYHDLLIEDDRCLFLMEYINGHPLSALVKPKGIIPLIHALGLFKQTLEAVAHAHSQGIIHGGLTPDKAIYAQEKWLKVGDFGLRPILWQLGAIADRADSAYLAPELSDPAVAPTRQSDVYSLGVFLVQLFIGRPPDAQPGSAQDQLQALRPDLPERVLKIVAKAASPDPAERFQTADELLSAVTGEETVVSREPVSGRFLPVLKAKPQTRAAVVPALSFEPEMALIPAGPFLLGSKRVLNEQPIREIFLPDYEMSKYPITNRSYRIFCDKTGRKYQSDPEGWDNYFTYCPDHPVIHVSWHDAMAYCQWLAEATGKAYKLPDETEWEKAARGGLRQQDYPWGDEEPEGRALYGGRSYAWELTRTGVQTLKVGSYPPNGYGLYDMAGNVWEWCENWYAPYDASEERKRRGLYKVARGGSWGVDDDSLRCAYRMSFSLDYRDYYIGFRVMRTLPSEQKDDDTTSQGS